MKARLLGIDDDPTTLLTYRAILSRGGCDFVGTKNGGEALALIQDIQACIKAGRYQL